MWRRQSLNEVPNQVLDQMFDLYVNTYSSAGQTLWFKSKQDLLRYNCILSYNLDDNNILICYLLFSLYRLGNKISLFAHNGTDQAKNLVLSKLVEVLYHPGNFIEASGAVSWTLRKRGLFPILDQDLIEAMLELDLINRRSLIEGQRVDLTTNYDVNSKGIEVYNHIFYNKLDNQILYQNAESIYGLPCAEFNNNQCDRKCLKLL